MKRLRIIIVAFLAAILAGAGLAALLHDSARLPVLSEGGEAPQPGDDRPHMQGLTYTHVEKGVKKWTLAAQGARYDEGSGQVFLTHVDVDFFTEKGDKVSIRGDEGTYDQKRQVVTLTGNVRGRTADGKTLVSDQMSYSEKDQVVTTESPVTITGPDFSIKSVGMVVVVPKSYVIFKSQVDSTFIPKGKGPPPGATVEDEKK